VTLNILPKKIEKTFRILFVLAILLITAFLYYLTIGFDESTISFDQSGALQQLEPNWSVAILNFLSPSSSESELQKAINATTFFLSFAIATIAVIISLVKSAYVDDILTKWQSAIPYKTYKVEVDGVDDINAMINYYRYANKISVFSGDFSWISGQGDMPGLIKNLLEDRKIQLYTYKRASELRTSMGDDVYFRVLPFLHVHSGPKLKASMIELQGGAQHLLYKKSRENGESVVVSFANRDVLAEPLNKFQQLIDSTPMKPMVLFVCGETGSGKSAIASRLSSKLGGQVVSVGNIFRELAILSGAPNDRNSIISVGKKYLEQYGENALAHEIESKIDINQRLVVVDGLRPLGTLQTLLRKYQRSIVLYIDASNYNRNARLKDIDLTDLDEDIDKLVRPLKGNGSDLVIINDKNGEGELQKILDDQILEKFPCLLHA
jgi:cytidylate kinase